MHAANNLKALLTHEADMLADVSAIIGSLDTVFVEIDRRKMQPVPVEHPIEQSTKFESLWFLHQGLSLVLLSDLSNFRPIGKCFTTTFVPVRAVDSRSQR